ncbi:helix-turn-helix domain-containing protein [Methylophaga sp.]|uniref:helix-turn-helix domain-containing protein n=1 Tax=Methylophaga sp. TaxID=2024840 RepID=UPI00271A9E77|nr:helix-turn-helix domain-containing protein [Methylophaga sp.]MDO8827709.1 helix-turn-helix domain-containing protein [Methylophaga sp.]
MNDSAAVLELKKKDQKQLRKISEQTSVNSPRAKALLLLSEGTTPDEAAEQSTLSLGQVRYWLGRYRATGIDCFPDEIDAESKPNTKLKKSESKKAKKADKKDKAKKADKKDKAKKIDKKKDKAKKLKKSKSKK